jgi:ditrans,polycis-polyprenyl diphosphate synthase
MDGNRRYAEHQHIDKIGGHKAGYRKVTSADAPNHHVLPCHCMNNTTLLQMVDLIQWCLELGIKHVSVYAFSTDNFKRSNKEVSDLMDLVATKCNELMQVRKHGIPCIGIQCSLNCRA